MTNIEQRVFEVNQLFEATNAIAQQVQKQLEPFVGRKVILQDGSLSKRVKDAVTYWKPDIEKKEIDDYATVVNRIITRSGQHLIVQVKVSFSGTHHTRYQDTFMVLGRLGDNKEVLQRLTDLELKKPLNLDLEEHRVSYYKRLQKKLTKRMMLFTLNYEED